MHDDPGATTSTGKLRRIISQNILVLGRTTPKHSREHLLLFVVRAEVRHPANIAAGQKGRGEGETKFKRDENGQRSTGGSAGDLIPRTRTIY